MLEWLTTLTELLKASAELLNVAGDTVVKIASLATVPTSNGERISAARGKAAGEAAAASSVAAAVASRCDDQNDITRKIVDLSQQLQGIAVVSPGDATCGDCLWCSDGGCQREPMSIGHEKTRELLLLLGSNCPASRCIAWRPREPKQ